MTNDANRAWRLLQTSPLPVRVLGPLGSASFADYLRDAHLLLYVQDLMRRGRNNTVVIMLDAWDVVWLGCRRKVVDSFLELKRPLFFSAEMGFYPFGQPGLDMLAKEGIHYPIGAAKSSYAALPHCHAGPRTPCKPKLSAAATIQAATCSFCAPEASGGGYRFLNNGCYGGYAWALERALSQIYQAGDWRSFASDHGLTRGLSWRALQDLSQAVWHIYYLTHPKDIAIDYGASICLTLHGLDAKREIVLRQNRAVAPAFHKEVCFAHANGDSNLTHVEELMSQGGRRLAAVARIGASAAARLRYGKPLLMPF